MRKLLSLVALTLALIAGTVALTDDAFACSGQNCNSECSGNGC